MNHGTIKTSGKTNRPSQSTKLAALTAPPAWNHAIRPDLNMQLRKLDKAVTLVALRVLFLGLGALFLWAATSQAASCLLMAGLP